ncbi:hypothetical protein DMUE_0018 [Dictyocoela muelleri]|nr:hypothetical protein DMUE_0018 [Dictyocoela muelleri]
MKNASSILPLISPCFHLLDFAIFVTKDVISEMYSFIVKNSDYFILLSVFSKDFTLYEGYFNCNSSSNIDSTAFLKSILSLISLPNNNFKALKVAASDQSHASLAYLKSFIHSNTS